MASEETIKRNIKVHFRTGYNYNNDNVHLYDAEIFLLQKL